MYSLRFLGRASFFATSCIFSRSFRARSSGPVDVPLHLSPQVCHRACQQLRCLVCVEDGRQGYRPATVERLEFMQKKEPIDVKFLTYSYWFDKRNDRSGSVGRGQLQSIDEKNIETLIYLSTPHIYVYSTNIQTYMICIAEL